MDVLRGGLTKMIADVYIRVEEIKEFDFLLWKGVRTSLCGHLCEMN